ncbi:L,D-transpeptidase family protein [Flavobacterium hiemivividum]|uniref:L,D-transpeptidase n=1 Tax=Flavobacterium hiemivividum TaxID=2541734 RepID=A0A4R5D0Z5_9FLAO|nr:L,D-transpeptidase family protein [Flavobacterium hiemivividum]TDE05111.1 L,D-transpeptidase [Flavobacterium hiemivividum]
MKKLSKSIAFFCFLFLLINVSCKKKDIAPEVIPDIINTTFDSTLVQTFFAEHPKLAKYQSEVEQLYRQRKFHYIWYENHRVNEFGNVLHNKLNNLAEEGIQDTVPYKEKLDRLYEYLDLNQRPKIETELLHSALYFFYADKVYHGLDPKKSTEMEWYLPRNKQSYVNYLDSLLVNPSLINKRETGVLSQYFLLKKVLKEYRQIEKKGGWKTINIDPKVKAYKLGDSSATIAQIRERLFISGDLSKDSKSAIYDKDLAKGVLKYQKRSGTNPSTDILPKHISDMNVTVGERIKTLIVNMERCRWVSNDITKAKELIAINIPAYQLTFFRDGKPELRSNVVVGKVMNKTVIFSAPMKYIVFSPYWNIPKSILENEILPSIAKNANYLEEHDMEWHDDYVRQRPGPTNSLGLIKFLFPNSNAIYLHDTPAKSLFNREDRAFSHGCIRVEKPVELATLIMKNDRNWDEERVREAMNKGEEKWYTLKNKIPVYIGYFTAWVDDQGEIHFYEDVYKRDDQLASLLFVK